MKKTTQQQPVKTRRKYDDTFKQQALQMLRLGQSVPAVAAALGIGEGLLYQWKQGQRPDVLDQELEQLRARLKQVEAELLEGGAFRDVAEAATRNVRLHRARATRLLEMTFHGQGLGAKTPWSLKLEFRIGAIPIPSMQG